MSDKLLCPICGGETDNGIRRQCVGRCRLGDRQRLVYQVVKSLRKTMSSRDALIFSDEIWVDKEWFKTCEFSIYKGENHLDLVDLSSVKNSYSWIGCNHILEHVQDDKVALRELFAVLTNDGLLQLQVPSPGSYVETTDWGYPDPKKYGHYREYGLDVSLTIKNALPTSSCAGIFAKDPLTPLRDIIYVIGKNQSSVLSAVKEAKEIGGYMSVLF